jgi:DNA invertase Pin-like site-specific DNA recombinase
LQTQFPIFPEGVTNITPDLAFKKEDGMVTYFNFSMPVFMHREDELSTFRMITSQFCVNGNATQKQIAEAFGVTLISVKRWAKVYRKKGPKGFYQPRNTRGAAVLTESVINQVQNLLCDEVSIGEIAKQLNLKPNTINKAIRAGRLYKPTLKKKSI